MALQFDPNNSFEENVAAFRQHLEGIDAECAEIFFDNLDTLFGDGNPARARANRTLFNEAVLAQLETLPKKTGGE